MDNPRELVASTDIGESDYFIIRDGQLVLYIRWVTRFMYMKG